jgi:hypothetical protein
MINAQTILILVGSIALAYLYYRYHKGAGQEMIIAFLISFGWVSWSGLYNYSANNTFFYGINLFPLICWTAGLVALRETYERLKGPNKFWIATGMYIAAIIGLEWVGYNMWGIQLASTYPGLFGFPLMHMPLYGQIFYLLSGPVYLKITDYLGVK